MKTDAMKEGTIGMFARRMESNFIPGDPRSETWNGNFSRDFFERFRQDRVGLILSEVKGIISDSSRVEASADEKFKDDDN